MIEDDLCSFCNEDIESLPHILIECEVAKIFWSSVQQWLLDMTGILYILTAKEIILGINHDNLTFINIVYLIGKKYIYRCVTQQEFPNIDSFIAAIKKYYDIERTIAYTNLTIRKFQLTWGPIAF